MTMRLEDKEELPVIELFERRSRHKLMSAALEHLDTEEWTRIGTLIEHADVSRQTASDNIDMLVEYGLLERKSEDAPHPFYRLADTRVVDAIRGWDGYPLTELFAYTGRLDLVRFFLERADPEASYSMNAIANEIGSKHSTVSEHIDVLVDAGLVDAVEGTRSTEYQLNTDSDIYEYLLELNERIYETVQARVQ